MRTPEQIREYGRAYSKAYYWKNRSKLRAEFKLADRAEILLSHREAIRTYKEVAAIMDLSPEYIRQLEYRAFKKLRNHPRLLEHWLEFKRNQT